MTPPLKVAVVTGHHPFDIPSFYALFRGMPEFDCYPQDLDDFTADAGKVRAQYDVVLFYNMHRETPGNEQGWWEKHVQGALEQLGETPQGIVVLHHALLAFPAWPLWSAIVGIGDREISGYKFGQTVRVEIANPAHPITHGIEPWEMVDETYALQSAGAGSEILLTTDHPESIRTLAWTRQYRQARVFCYQSGHDRTAYTCPSFREVLRRGMLWAADRL